MRSTCELHILITAVVASDEHYCRFSMNFQPASEIQLSGIPNIRTLNTGLYPPNKMTSESVQCGGGFVEGRQHARCAQRLHAHDRPQDTSKGFLHAIHP